MFVDSQCHTSAIWYEPVESLVAQMDLHGVAQAVLIQMLGQTDNRYQQEALKRYPGRFASVVLVDPSRPDALQVLRQLADEGASGVRLRPIARSPGDDPLAIWRCAETLGLPVSCVGTSAGFAAPEFFELVSAFPRLRIVIEHLGGTSQPDTDDATRALRQKVFDLAQYANVYMKVPGLGELSPRKMPPQEALIFEFSVPQILLDAVERFGSDRLMWGSDFPPVSSREGYGNALNLCRAALAHLPDQDQQRIFAGTAREVFKLPQPG